MQSSVKRIGANGACGLLFCVALQTGTLPPSMLAGLRFVFHVSAIARGRSPGTGGIRSKQDQRRGYNILALVHVLPGANKQREFKPSILLS
jgi:hypothetical protein